MWDQLVILVPCPEEKERVGGGGGGRRIFLYMTQAVLAAIQCKIWVWHGRNLWCSLSWVAVEETYLEQLVMIWHEAWWERNKAWKNIIKQLETVNEWGAGLHPPISERSKLRVRTKLKVSWPIWHVLIGSAQRSGFMKVMLTSPPSNSEGCLSI